MVNSGAGCVLKAIPKTTYPTTTSAIKARAAKGTPTITSRNLRRLIHVVFHFSVPLRCDYTAATESEARSFEMVRSCGIRQDDYSAHPELVEVQLLILS